MLEIATENTSPKRNPRARSGRSDVESAFAIAFIFWALSLLALVALTWKLEHLNEEHSKRYRWKFVSPESSKEKDHVER